MFLNDHRNSVSHMPGIAGELLAVASEFMHQDVHPSVVIGGYMKALEDMLDVLEKKIWCV